MYISGERPCRRSCWNNDLVLSHCPHFAKPSIKMLYDMSPGALLAESNVLNTSRAAAREPVSTNPRNRMLSVRWLRE